MSMFTVIAAERDSAREQERPLLWLRVTPDAIPGAPVALSLTPERFRAHRPLIVEFDDRGPLALADPLAGRSLELLIHPLDWADLLRETLDDGSYLVRVGDPNRVFGIPVIQG